MTITMENKQSCDRIAVSHAIKELNLSKPATRIGQYMVDMLGYEYSIMIWQLKKGLVMDEGLIEECLEELIASGVVRQQPRVGNKRTYVVNHTFGVARKAAIAKQEQMSLPDGTKTIRRGHLTLIHGGKAD